MNRIRIDLTGRYNTITIRSDVKEWLDENYEQFGKEYAERYRTKGFAKFVNYFIMNLLESKFETQSQVIRLKESDFKWLHEEYRKAKNSSKMCRMLLEEMI